MKRRAFSLLETLVACALMGIALLIVGQLLNAQLRNRWPCSTSRSG
jgi:prepilin-type N-terminal cleavage/methylation domain-containing protein